MTRSQNPLLLRRAVFLSMLLLALLLTSCGGRSETARKTGYDLAPLSEMPDSVQRSAVEVQEAYRFAVANPEILTELPCYCGCLPMGHTSNYACYVKEVNGEEITFDEHALGCSICVDITQDAMRLLDDGKSLSEIREYIDTTYAQYGPSNMP